MDVNKSKSVLIAFVVLIIICLNFLLLNKVIGNSDTQKTFEKNLRLKH